MMFDIYFIVSLFVFSVLCFLVVIVFNEEILLSMCFFCFIFFSFNSLGDSIFETFQSRASKFEEDLLISYSNTKDNINSKFDNYTSFRSFVSKFKVISLCVEYYLITFTNYYTYKWFSLFVNSSYGKLSELVLFESKLISVFQEKSISLLLYPLIFQTKKNTITLITSAAANSLPKQQSNKVNILTTLSK